jgi:hypothetical protein
MAQNPQDLLSFIRSGLPSWLGGTQTWGNSGGAAATPASSGAGSSGFTPAMASSAASMGNPWGDTEGFDTSKGSPYSGPVTGFTPEMAQSAQSMGNPWGDTSGFDISSGASAAGGAAGGLAGALGTLSKLSDSGSQSQKRVDQMPLPQQASSAGFHQGTQPTALAEMLANQGNRASWFLQNLNPNQSGLLGRQ